MVLLITNKVLPAAVNPLLFINLLPLSLWPRAGRDMLCGTQPLGAHVLMISREWEFLSISTYLGLDFYHGFITRISIIDKFH